MGHLTALKDLRQKGFVDSGVRRDREPRSIFGGSGRKARAEAKAISTSPRHRRAYEGALRRLQDWLDGRTLAEYLAARFGAGRVEHSGAD